MTPEEIDITDMQCWVFRMAQTSWGRTSLECAELFKEHDVLGFIAELYGLLHLSGYRAALDEVETYLRSKGVEPCQS
ncbi:DUF3791 domain-containing protein [Arabiibacter massiliensis]|uniref:DUF3791 domain-containing protein n=1 Tax=Arabiibacter massiliensis TaxID=1870985 RepID=UPI0009BA8E55|nr:DUF3791 domain-containing protein [Arabiibacter massiliensis]